MLSAAISIDPALRAAAEQPDSAATHASDHIARDKLSRVMPSMMTDAERVLVAIAQTPPAGDRL